MSLPQTLRTLRYLRPIQYWGRVKRVLRRYRQHEAPEHPRDLSWEHVRLRTAPLAPCTKATAEDVRDNVFNLLNQRTAFGDTIDWAFGDNGSLWAFHLHYMDYLWVTDFDDARRVVLDWMDRNPYGRGTGWHPFVVAQRLTNWVLLFRGRWLELTESDEVLNERLLESAFAQTWFLSHNLELDLLGNHLYKDLMGLTSGCAVLRSPAVDPIRSRAEGMIAWESRGLFLADGGHIERSPMYHALALVDVLHALNLLPEGHTRRLLAGIAERGLAWLREMTGPDGELFRFGDSTGEVSPPTEQILAYGAKVISGVDGRRLTAPVDLPGESSAKTAHSGPKDTPAIRVCRLDHSGFCVVRTDRTVFAVNMGGILCDYQPGHAHGDIFSFVLYVDDVPVVVDPGVCEYATGAIRDYARSTAAHSTVEVAGLDQHEFWAAHRVGRRARVLDVKWESTFGETIVSGLHDGYRHLRGRPMHEREFRISETALTVADTVRGGAGSSCVARVHIHPELTLKQMDDASFEVSSAEGSVFVSLTSRGAASVVSAWYYPEFGQRRRAQAVELRGMSEAGDWYERLVVDWGMGSRRHERRNSHEDVGELRRPAGLPVTIGHGRPVSEDEPRANNGASALGLGIVGDDQ